MPIARGQWAKHRMSGRKAFARVFGARHSAANGIMVVYALPNEVGRTRLGLSVGRKIGNAVRRNRLKRLIREAFRAAYDELPFGFDLICIPRPGIEKRSDQYVASLKSVSARAVKRQAPA